LPGVRPARAAKASASPGTFCCPGTRNSRTPRSISTCFCRPRFKPRLRLRPTPDGLPEATRDFPANRVSLWLVATIILTRGIIPGPLPAPPPPLHGHFLTKRPLQSGEKHTHKLHSLSLDSRPMGTTPRNWVKRINPPLLCSSAAIEIFTRLTMVSRLFARLFARLFSRLFLPSSYPRSGLNSLSV
jgi:hypothetical protein